MKFKFSFIIFILGFVLFTSCSKENQDQLTVEEEEVTTEVVSCDLGIEITENAAGEITATVTGGTSPYEMIWSNGDVCVGEFTECALSADSNGDYTANVTDSEGCTYSVTYAVTGFNNDPCDGFSVEIVESAAGEITATVTGGASPYQFVWSNGDTFTGDFTESAFAIDGSGTYSVLVVDGNNCTVDNSILIP